MAAIPAEAILALIQSADEYRPVVKSTIETLKSYGPELKDLFASINTGLVDLKAQSVFQYEAKGFTREQAILLTIDSSAALQKALQNSSANNGKK